MVRLSIFIAVLVWLASWRPVPAWAADPSIRLVGPSGLVRAEEIVPIEVHIDSAGQSINAAEVTLNYSTVLLEITRVIRDENVFSLWPQPPIWNNANGRLTMAGGRPGGIIAADARIATLFVRARSSGLAALVLDSAQSGLYRHDGLGTRLASTPNQLELRISDPLVGGVRLLSPTHADAATWSRTPRIEVTWETQPDTQYSYQLNHDIAAVPDDVPEIEIGRALYESLADGKYYFTIKSRGPDGAWSFVIQRPFLIDQTPPEPFSLERLPASALGGDTVISWNPVDRGSGIVRSRLRVNNQSPITVTSPLSLKPGWSGTRLRITVEDAAGNTRSAELAATNSSSPLTWYGLIILAVLVLAFGLVWRRRSRPN